MQDNTIIIMLNRKYNILIINNMGVGGRIWGYPVLIITISKSGYAVLVRMVFYL